MKQLLRKLGWICVLALFWALGGYMVGVALKAFIAFFGITTHYPLSFIMAMINLIIGLLLFQGVIRDPTAERLFFQGPQGSEEGHLNVGCLWVLPASLILSGLLLWLVMSVLRWLFPFK
jgi:uncharacterized membrane protein